VRLLFDSADRPRGRAFEGRLDGNVLAGSRLGWLGRNMGFADDNLSDIFGEGHAARRGLGEKSLLDLRFQVEDDDYGRPLC